MRVLVLWSGGVESTSLLKWVLTETDWTVHAHHIRIDSKEAKLDMEERAIHALLPRLNRIRQFGITYSSVSVCSGLARPPESWLLYPIGAAAAQHKGARALLRGWCSEDNFTRIADAATGHVVRTELRHPRGQFGRWSEQLRALVPFVPPDQRLYNFAMWTETHEWAKAQHWAALGDWAQFTWSCRQPKNGKPCGHCRACSERKAAQEGRSTIAEINAELGHAH